jgi:hypothetical protein
MKAHVGIKSVNVISNSPRRNHHPSTTQIMKKPSFFEMDNNTEADVCTRVRVVVSGGTRQRSASISSIDNTFLDLGARKQFI